MILPRARAGQLLTCRGLSMLFADAGIAVRMGRKDATAPWASKDRSLAGRDGFAVSCVPSKISLPQSSICSDR